MEFSSKILQSSSMKSRSSRAPEPAHAAVKLKASRKRWRLSAGFDIFASPEHSKAAMFLLLGEHYMSDYRGGRIGMASRSLPIFLIRLAIVSCRWR
jgi:hypothetical protein